MSVVYFIQAGEGGPIKIGTAEDFAVRLRVLQTGCPDDVATLSTVPGDIRHERALHRALSAHRKRGEWFHPHADVLTAMRDAERGNFPPLPLFDDKPPSPEAGAQADITKWLAEMMALHGLSARAWAKKAGVGKDTVSRALRPEYACTVSTRTIARLKAALPN